MLSSCGYGILVKQFGSLAQLGEHLPYKQRVIGSIPITSTINSAECLLCGNSSVVERHLAKVNVAGSSLVSRSKYSSALFFWRYSQVVRQGSAKPLFPGSNPGGASKTSIYCVILSKLIQYVGVFILFLDLIGV